MPTRHPHPRPAVLVLVLVLVLCACGGSGAAAGSAAPPDLDGRTFVSTQVRGHRLVAGTAVTLAFEDGRLSASAGCNTLAGGVGTDGGSLSVEGELVSTLMGCPAELQAQDDWLTALLLSGPALALEGATLTLGDDDAGMTLEEGGP